MKNHRNRFHIPGISNRIWLTALLLLMATRSLAAGEEHVSDGSIIVTLKPLYSLVAHLSDGIETPTLLIKQSPSTHHYNLLPSQRQLLADAGLIIWFGPAMENYLSKAIFQQEDSNRKVTVISAMQAEHLNLLNKRIQGTHKNSGGNNSGRNSSADSKAKLQTIDPHIWLSTHNAAAISKHIAAALISYDPKNTASYNKNLRRLLHKIEQTKTFIQATLDNNTTSKRQPFIAYHDAFQYFEAENQLNHIDTISYNEETGPGLKHISQIKTRITENNIHCLVYQPPKPAIIDALSAQTSITATALDPLGTNVSDEKDAWFELMRKMATGFKNCLQQ